MNNPGEQYYQPCLAKQNTAITYRAQDRRLHGPGEGTTLSGVLDDQY